MIRPATTLLLAMLIVSCTGPMGPGGPMGPEGPEGQTGTSGEFHIKTGILYAADKTEDREFWDIPWFHITDSSLVQVWVRQGSGYMWQAPKWYITFEGDWYIRIFDDANTDAAYEYMFVMLAN